MFLQIYNVNSYPYGTNIEICSAIMNIIKSFIMQTKVSCASVGQLNLFVTLFQIVSFSPLSISVSDMSGIIRAVQFDLPVNFVFSFARDYMEHFRFLRYYNSYSGISVEIPSVPCRKFCKP